MPENYVWACASCNSSKGAKDVIAWLYAKGWQPSILVFRRYIKLVLLYAERHGLMDCALRDLPKELPFDIAAIQNPEVLSLKVAELYVPPLL